MDEWQHHPTRTRASAVPEGVEDAACVPGRSPGSRERRGRRDPAAGGGRTGGSRAGHAAR